MSIAQIDQSLQAAFALAKYPGTTTSYQVQQDLKSLQSALKTVTTTAVKGLPINVTVSDIKSIVPEIVAYETSFVRATSCLTNLYPPLSSPDGVSILPVIQSIHTALLELLGECRPRLPTAEVALSGYGKFFLTNLQSIINPYYESLIAAAPPTIQQSVIKQMQSAANAALQDTVAGLPL